MNGQINYKETSRFGSGKFFAKDREKENQHLALSIFLFLNCSYFFVLRRFAVGFGKFYLFGNSGGQSALKTCGTKQQSAMVISSPTQYLPAEVDRTFSTARKPRLRAIRTRQEQELRQYE
uniref:Uncharacterized protein n=1 Tax=Glossina pallidipes TaxID=7398 RepID=A0A1A9ZL57_GLOPL